jgi:hypothetical protein
MLIHSLVERGKVLVFVRLTIFLPFFVVVCVTQLVVYGMEEVQSTTMMAATVKIKVAVILLPYGVKWNVQRNRMLASGAFLLRTSLST